jgi:membrane fusion protein
MSILFRKEAAEHRSQRLHGDVILSQSLSSRGLAGFLAASFVLGAFWLSTGTYARTEAARGVLVTSSAAAKIVAARNGVVTALLVKDGDLVEVGQRLAVIQNEQPNSAGGRYTIDGIGSLVEQERLALQRAELVLQKAASDQRRLAATMAGLTQQSINLERQLAIQRQLVASARLSFEPLADLVDKGTISKVEFERRRQAFLAALQEENRLMQQVDTIATDLARTDADLGRTRIDGERETADVQTSIQTLRQQKARLQSEGDYGVDSPIAGRVTAVQSAVGKPAGGAVPLMVVVPVASPVRAEIYAPSRAIGFVRPGQEVRLLYDAFPYQRFGSFKGQIDQVSRVVFSPSELDVPLKIDEPVYRVTATLNSQDLQAFGESVPLQPGMLLTANIILDRRSFLDWLLAPFNAVGRRST